MKEETFQIFSTQHSVIILNIVSPLSPWLSLFPLPFSLLSFALSLSAWLSLSPCLVYLLSHPRKSRDYQGNNPSGRGLLLPASTESLLFFPLLLPSVLSYFLSEAGGQMMGDILLSAWNCKKKNSSNIHPLPFFSLSGLLLTKVCLLHFHYHPPFSACSSPLVYLLSPNKTRPIDTHTVYTPPVPRASCLSLIKVSSDWGGGCRPYTCPQINPAV